jgi:hypothetical protein
MSEIMNYPASGSLHDLSSTCGGDEDGLRGPLTNLERGVNTQGEKATRATYEPIPPQQPYNKKNLFFFDITKLTPKQIQDITVQQLGLKRSVLFDSANVYLNGAEAQVAVYRQQ